MNAHNNIIMVHKLIEFALRNRFIVLLVAGGLLVWGVISIRNNPIDAIPDLSENQVIVFTEWMGRSPQLIEDQCQVMAERRKWCNRHGTIHAFSAANDTKQKKAGSRISIYGRYVGTRKRKKEVRVE